MAEYLMPEKKQEIFAKYGKSNKDTGSPESQVALFSYRIAHLTRSTSRDTATSSRSSVSVDKQIGKDEGWFPGGTIPFLTEKTPVRQAQDV